MTPLSYFYKYSPAVANVFINNFIYFNEQCQHLFKIIVSQIQLNKKL